MMDYNEICLRRYEKEQEEAYYSCPCCERCGGRITGFYAFRFPYSNTSSTDYLCEDCFEDMLNDMFPEDDQEELADKMYDECKEIL